jgi:CRISPR-associated protein Cas1
VRPDARSAGDVLPPLKPIALKERVSLLFLEKGHLDVLDGAFVLVDQTGIRTHIPVGSVACLMLEPGIRISHAAVALASRVGCLLVWVGEAGVRVYASGQPGGALYPVDDPFWGRQYVKIPEQELDEQTLLKIAEATNGRYFRATDTASLERIFKQIDAMEKTEIKTTKYTNYTELYDYFLWPAVLLLGLELLLAGTWLRTLP